MEHMAMDVLKAKKLLLEQELDLKEQERHHLKSAGLKHDAMSLNSLFIKFAGNIRLWNIYALHALNPV